MIRDRNIQWARKRIYIPVWQFTGFQALAHSHLAFTVEGDETAGDITAFVSITEGDGTAQSGVTVGHAGGGAEVPINTDETAANVLLAGVDDGAPVFKEISTLGMMGLLTDTAGDSVSHLMRIPDIWSFEHEIGVRVYWTSGSQTAADTIDWIVLYDLTAEDAALAAAATALDTAIAQDTVGDTTAYMLKRTSRGIINRDSIADTDLFIAFNVEMDAFAAGLGEDKFLLGLEIDYAPTWTDGPGYRSRKI